MHRLKGSLWIMKSSVERNLNFCGSTYIVPFLCISLMYLFTEFPAFTMFAISCYALFLPPKLSTRGKLCFQNNCSLLVLLQPCNFFSICPIWLPLRHFLFSTVTNSNIQKHPTLNVSPHKVIKACIIHLLKN